MRFQEFMSELDAAHHVIETAHDVDCPTPLIVEAAGHLRQARHACPKEAARAYVIKSEFHLSKWHAGTEDGDYHYGWTVENIESAKAVALERNGRAVPRRINLEAFEWIASLPADDESPDRVESFHAVVSRSRHCAASTALLREAYWLAAEGNWGRTLADVNMLLYGLEINPDLATILVADGSIEAILNRINRDTARVYRDWLHESVL